MTSRLMPPHIIRHSCMVRMVAVAIAHSLLESGFTIDIKAVDRAALLHDICKNDTIVSGGDHALMGKELMEGYGYPYIADIIGQHIRLTSLDVNEAMVVNYADKRVMHDRVVSLGKRFVDLMDRYGSGGQRAERILSHYHHVCEVEVILVKASGIDPDVLLKLNLIPGDHPLYCCDGFLGQYGTVEE